ncbi:MAG TPA: hypothetical protein VNO79_14375 [Actinomycetota bacterium]|nr:hypothetical protein [Actinomycetota bacterium]
MEVAEVRAGATCPVCGTRLEAARDPVTADPWTCPDPGCPVTDDASAWMGGGE